MLKHIEIVAEQFKKAIRYQKCWKCGCQQEMTEALEKQLSNLRTEDRLLLEPLVRQSKTTFKPVQYDCLGCKVCFPAVATNELLAAYSELSFEAGCGERRQQEIQERPAWPPLPGNFQVLRYQASVAVCTLNSESMVADIAGSQNPDLSIVGKLNTENLGIEHIIRNIISNPHIRFLILCGEDSKQRVGHLPGQSLLSLAKNGVDSAGRIISAKGKRPVIKNVSIENIDMFRRQVQVLDLIGHTLSDDVLKKASECAAKSEGVFPEQHSKQISAEIVEASAAKRLVLDPNGYFVIFPDAERSMLVVEHYQNDGTLNRIIEGGKSSDVYMTAIGMGLLSRLDHACYFGKELSRAEESLRTETSYCQDKAQEPEEQPPGFQSSGKEECCS